MLPGLVWFLINLCVVDALDAPDYGPDAAYIAKVDDDAVEVVWKSSCKQADNDALKLDNDVVEIVFMRHGVSLNNVFTDEPMANLVGMGRAFVVGSDGEVGTKDKFASSDTLYQQGYAKVCDENICGPYTGDRSVESLLQFELDSFSQDSLLHPSGEVEAEGLKNTLSQILPPGTIHGFYSSPLRRTLQTLLAAWPTHFATPDTTDAPNVHVQPWLHERYNSRSDLALDGKSSAGFLDKLFQAKKKEDSWTSSSVLFQASVESAIETMQMELTELGDWTGKAGLDHPTPGTTKVHEVHEENTAMFYKITRAVSNVKGGFLKEAKKDLRNRMTILRRWMKLLPAGNRYVLSSHGNVGKALFESYASESGGVKLANNGILVARFKPGTADATKSEEFFDKGTVKLAREAWNCDDLPGWEKG